MRNEPAFPSEYIGKKYNGDVIEKAYKGMPLRDYFAAKAMSATFSSGFNFMNDVQLVAKLSYKIADAMLTQRQKRIKSIEQGKEREEKCLKTYQKDRPDAVCNAMS